MARVELDAGRRMHLQPAHRLEELERLGAAIESAIATARQRREDKRERSIGAAATEEREMFVEAVRERSDEQREPVLVVTPTVDVPRSERVVKEKQKPLFQDLPDSPLPPTSQKAIFAPSQQS